MYSTKHLVYKCCHVLFEWSVLCSLQASRDYVVGQIMLACTEIIKIVEARGDLDQSVEEPGYMAATLEKVCYIQLQL